jgi:pyridinium-3,5-bisthiocarboxylic acid mononucleotide nickel chelatase
VGRFLVVDVIGGAAGDMLLAALIDAGAPIEDVQRGVDAVLPGRFGLATDVVTRGGLRARVLQVDDRGGRGPRGGGRRVDDLLNPVRGAELPDPVRERALAILERLAVARVHGVDPRELELHELGDDDTILDAVGVSAALESFGADSVLVSSLPLGGGEPIRTSHGELPGPAPVTLELLKGFRVTGEGVGETVTPTGAAILAALGRPIDRLPALTVEAIGYGAGTRDPAGVPNVVRVLVPTESSAAAPEEVSHRPERELLVLECNLDDLTPELVADAAEALLAAGALDVWTTPALMKKGRSAVVLSALCEPARRPEVLRAFFGSTPTFGVRSFPVGRTELDRRTVLVDLPDGRGAVRVKVGLLGGRVMSAKPEHDDVAALAARTGRPTRVVHDEALAAARSLRADWAEELGR